jgi:hypothetical protein
MKLHTLRTLYLLLYLFIASQGMFYLIGINKALLNISISAFIEQRKSIDAAIGDPLRLLYFSSIGIAILLLSFTFRTPSSIIFITVLLSLLCILADVSLAVKKSIPLNEIINNYPSNQDRDMQILRAEWVSYINLRGSIAIMGLFILLSGFLIESFSNAAGSQNRKKPESLSTFP